MELLIFYAALAIGVSFVCSMLEAALLSLPHSHVQVLVDAGSRAGTRLADMKQNIDRPLTAILTFNTIANTVGAVGVGAQAASVFGDHAIGIASAILTAMILVVSEIIPKTLGALHTKRLAGATAVLTSFMMLLCYPLIWAIERLSRAFGYARRTQWISRAELIAALRLGQRGGSLARHEFHVISHVLALGNVRLSDILTPRTVLFALPRDMTVEQAIDEHQPIRYARFPVYGESMDNITGYVARYDMRKAHAGDGRDQTLAQIAKPIEVLPNTASVADALEMMLQKQQHITLVVDEHGGTAGIVTLEDTLETLLGQEIVDETDLVVDMRKLAKLRAGNQRD